MGRKSVLVLIVAGSIACITVFLGMHWPFFGGIDFVGEKSPEYLEYVHERVNFGTNPVKTVQQRDTLFDRIDRFFSDSSQCTVPDSIPLFVSFICTGGCAQKEVLIYFDHDTIEVYRVTFDMQGYNYVDAVYYASGNFDEVQTTQLSGEEKDRIVRRIRREVVDKIDWNFDQI